MEKPYLQHIFALIGFLDVHSIGAGGTYQVDRGMKSRDEYFASLGGEVDSAAGA